MSVKCDIKATELRNEGNIYYQQSMFHEALLKYNESLCFAETKETLALAYANRSAVYMEMKFYEQCLNNIRLAREHNYPIEKIKTLDDREVKCIQLKEVETKFQETPFDPFKLSYKANKKIPFIIEGLKLDEDEKFGRKIMAKQSLKVGDIICIESPYFKIRVFDDNQDSYLKFNYCSLCFFDHKMDLVPCAGCTNTMYCNKDCEKIAQHQYHKYMCRESSENDYLNILFFKALGIMNGSIDDLQLLFEECLKSPKTIFDFDFSNQDDPEHSKNQLRAALSLAGNRTCCLTSPFDPKIFEAIGFCSKHKQFILTFLNHLYQIINAVSVEIKASKFRTNLTIRIGVSAYLFGALVNHSCAPNIMRNFYKDKMCFLVIRPIKKGEQLFDNYGPSFTNCSVSKRQEYLRNYSFVCDCVACLDPETYKKKTRKISSIFDSNVSLDNILHQHGPKHFMSNFKHTLQKLHSLKNYTSEEYHAMLFAFHHFLLRLSKMKVASMDF